MQEVPGCCTILPWPSLYGSPAIPGGEGPVQGSGEIDCNLIVIYFSFNASNYDILAQASVADDDLEEYINAMENFSSALSESNAMYGVGSLIFGAL